MTEEMTPTTELTEESVDMPTNLFGDDDQTETEAIPAAEPTEEAPVPEETETVAEEQPKPFLTIKYNKEQKGLSQEEAVELAQKGMNYDTIYDRYNTLNSELTQLAQANGMSVEDYIKNLNDVQNQFEINREAEHLKSQYGDIDDTVLNELAKYRINDKRNVVNQKAEADKSASRQEIERQLDKFQTRYPNVDPSKLDQEVYSLMSGGYTLLEAYEAVQSDRRSAEQRAKDKAEASAKMNEENKKRSLGNLDSTGAVNRDDFLSGFFSD